MHHDSNHHPPPESKFSEFSRTLSEEMKLVLPDLACLSGLLKIIQKTVILGKAQSY